MKTWLMIIEDRLLKDRAWAPVFNAVGYSLKEAMIAKEVMDIQLAQAVEDAPISKFNELYEEARRKLLPELYEEAVK